MATSYSRYDIIDYSSPYFFTETTTAISPPKPLSLFNRFFDIDDHFSLLNPNPNPNASPFSLLDFPTVTDLVHVETTPFRSCRRLVRVNQAEFHLQALSDRVAALESRFDRLLEVRREKKRLSEVDRRYTWTAEIKDGVERKYKWMAEIDADDEKRGKRGERKYQWSTEIKGRDDEKRTYTWKAIIGGDEKKTKDKKKDKKKEQGSCATRIVEIESPHDDHRTVVLRQAFNKRYVAAKDKGKKKELAPQEAAAMIQMTFRAYLLRRSQALRALRELAVAKTKLKELRALFHNFSYRNRVARDAEERQKFSEKIIVLLLTVDAIEGVDVIVRAAKKSMVDELEAMLDVVDPQSSRRSVSLRRRTFDMPSGGIQKEIAEGVAQVVEMLDQESGTFDQEV